ncbi:Putative nuclease HARBI1, partial [Trachymyrmex zeteki]
EESDNEDFEMLLTTIHLKEKPNHIVGYMENIANFTNTEFQRHFGLSLEAFKNLLEQVGPLLKSPGNEIKQPGRPLIDARKQLFSVIWILATPDLYRSVGERFDMTKSSLSTCFVRVINGLCTIAPQIIKWPQGIEIDAITEKFEKTILFELHVIGAIDGTYIPIKAPKVDAESYINRKCFHAITLQGICGREHRCAKKCPRCYAFPSCEGSSAELVRICNDCGRFAKSNPRHNCDVIFCKICLSLQTSNHSCYMQPLRRKVTVEDTGEGTSAETLREEKRVNDENDVESVNDARSKKDRVAFVFYDFETRQDERLDAQRNGERKDTHTDSLRRATNL